MQNKPCLSRDPKLRTNPNPKFEPQVSRLAITHLEPQLLQQLIYVRMSKLNQMLPSYPGIPKSRLYLPKTEAQVSRLALTSSEPQILQQLHLHKDTETQNQPYTL